tara:strand:- start:17575 stop:17838 length:264 start_codon:yes stop_codon:yes gene_type:complete
MVLRPPLADLCRKRRTEAISPEPDRFVRDIDPALVERIHDVPQRKRKTDVHHHRKAADFERSLELFKRITHRARLVNYLPALKAKHL